MGCCRSLAARSVFALGMVVMGCGGAVAEQVGSSASSNAAQPDAGHSVAASDAGHAGDAGVEVPGIATTAYTLTTTPFELLPGQEKFMCQNFDNPFPGDVAVVKSESTMTPGSHHLFVFYEPSWLSAGGPLPCSGIEFTNYLHAAQTPEHTIVYPYGVGVSVRREQKLRIAMHYVNLSRTETLHPQASVVFHAAEPAAVRFLAGNLFLNDVSIDVGPGQVGSATDTCTVPYPMNVINAQSHMHQHATHFRAQTGSGALIYETRDWNEPKAAVFEPPLALAAGDTITFRCDYFNDTQATLSFGEHAATNEMCIFGGVYYPAPEGRLWNCINGTNF